MNLMIVMLISLVMGAILFQQFDTVAVILVGFCVFIWYRIYRTKPGEPATEADLAVLEKTMHETFDTLPVADFRAFLARIAPYFAGGFGQNEIERLDVLATGLKPGRETRIELQVEFLGESTPLRFHIKKQPDEILIIHFTSTEAVTEFLQASIVARASSDSSAPHGSSD